MNLNEIYFSEFLTKYTNNILDYVILNKSKYKCLKDIRRNGSCEGGFELPLTQDWINQCQSDLWKYRSYRDFRLITKNDKIIGIRCKDNLKYWSDEEKNAIQTLVSEGVKFLN